MGVRSKTLFSDGIRIATLPICAFQRLIPVRGFPLTPRPPTPQKFGLSFVRLDSLIVRIYGERGSQIIFGM